MLAQVPVLTDTDLPRLRDTVGLILDAGVRDSVFPGAVAVIGTGKGGLVQRAAGHLDWAASPPPNDSTLWDLASLTKVVALTTAVMQLTERGRVELDAQVARYLPEFVGAGKERVTVRQLLTHSSGLPAWRPLFREAPTTDSAMALVFATPLDTVPGARMVYSDLGAILLGQIVTRVSGEPFDRYVQERILGPLGMRDTQFRPPPALWERVAPTEVDTVYRKRHVRGEVHDENAFALGGVSSHAGLFSTARDMVRFARMMLSGGRLDGASVVTSEAIATFTRVQDPGVSHRALGWETANGKNSGGHLLSRSAYGHTGFTGTSLWIDPENDLFILLLTNRVNPTRERTGIAAVRVALADAALTVLRNGPAGARQDALSRQDAVRIGHVEHVRQGDRHEVEVEHDLLQTQSAPPPSRCGAGSGRACRRCGASPGSQAGRFAAPWSAPCGRWNRGVCPGSPGELAPAREKSRPPAD